jgi:Domain of unknown function (DUF4126)
VRLLIDILQGAGLAGAAGIRPFLPALVAGAFASADLGVDYEGTPFSFLEMPGWLLALVVAVIAAVIAERRGVPEGPLESALSGLGIGLGALLFAATLADHFDLWWPGLLGGGLCAALAGAATRSLVARTRARLDPEARAALPVYVEGTAIVLAALAIVVAPISVLALGFFAFLLRGGRRREGEKYAGLRILR